MKNEYFVLQYPIFVTFATLETIISITEFYRMSFFAVVEDVGEDKGILVVGIGVVVVSPGADKV